MTPSLIASILAGATVTVAIALFVSRIARKSRAAVRHLWLAAAFAVLFVLPLGSAIAPAIRRPVQVAPPSAVMTTLTSLSATFAPAATAPQAVPSSPAAPPPQAVRPISWLICWIVGAGLCSWPVLLGLRELRAVRRDARPWKRGRHLVEALSRDLSLGRHVEIALHPVVSGPITYGIVRPMIVMPADVEEWADEDVTRAIVHELEHVRRADWFTLCLARAICVVYWFHPLVWIARRRLELEAERACDDAVLRMQSSTPDTNATAYADQLVGLARRLSTESHSPLVAMASRRDLATRVRALLDDGQARGRAGTIAMTSVCAIALGLIAMMAPLRIVAQTRPKFDAAALRPCPTSDPAPPSVSGGRQSGSPISISPGHVTAECVTATRLIALAYVINGEGLVNNAASENPDEWIKNTPGWARSEKYTLEATADSSADRKALLGPMLQDLLEDRFKLKIHQDQQQTDLYALTVAKSGLKLKPMAPGGCLDASATPTNIDEQRAYIAAVQAGGPPRCGSLTMLGGTTTGSWVWATGGQTMDWFARTLSNAMDRRVIDKTGLDGLYNIRLEFTPDEHATWPRGTPPPENPEGPTMFRAIEQQLGLKLEPVKGPQGFLYVDHIERPAIR